MMTDQLDLHVDDDAILHLVDEDAPPGELAAWARHADVCESCAKRLRERRRDSEIVRSLISELQLPAGFPDADALMAAAGWRADGSGVSTFPLRRPWLDGSALKVAAAALLVITSLALMSPVRAAVVEWVRQMTTERSDPPAEGAGAVNSEIEDGYALRFNPGGREVRIRIDSRQPAGALIVTRGNGAEAFLEMPAGSGEALISESVVRLRNEAASRSDYRLGVPPSVDLVTIEIADAPPMRLMDADFDTGRRVELQ
jgi:hypothetical protein